MSKPSRSDEPPIINITGGQVALGPLRRDLVPLYGRWLNDFRHARNFDDTPEPWTTERTLALYEERSTNAGSAIAFTVYERPDLRPVGYTMLLDISQRHRSAEFAIHIGEDDAHGKGY